MSKVGMAAFAVVAMLLSQPTLGQSLKDQPGYVDFGDLNGITGSEPTVEISLGSVLLRFLTESIRDEDSELAETLSGLRSIRVSVFEVDESQAAAARKRVKDISRLLQGQEWEPAISIQSEDSAVRMFMKTHNDRVAGLTVMVVDDGSDAVFMNIVGEIDPSQLGRVASKFGVPLSLDD